MHREGIVMHLIVHLKLNSYHFSSIAIYYLSKERKFIFFFLEQGAFQHQKPPRISVGSMGSMTYQSSFYFSMAYYFFGLYCTSFVTQNKLSHPLYKHTHTRVSYDMKPRQKQGIKNKTRPSSEMTKQLVLHRTPSTNQCNSY